MAKEEKEAKNKPDKKEITTTGNKWNLAVSFNDQQTQELLNDDWEPFAVDRRRVFFKKK